MDPYVVISVGGQVAYRSEPATKAHKNPTWDASFPLHAKEVPESVNVAVWSKNRWRKDVLCGSVTLPLINFMGWLQEKDFALTLRHQVTGKICLSLTQPGKSMMLRSSGSMLGGEMDHIVQWIEEPGSGKGLSRAGLSCSGSHGSLELAEMPEDGADDNNSGHPTLLSGRMALKVSEPLQPSRPDVPALTPQQSMLSGGSQLPTGAVAPVAAVPVAEGAAVAAGVEAEPGAGDQEEQGLPEPLAGHWDCVDTFGLEEFLTKAGLGAFQRRLAMAARWPSWDFKILPDRVKFINHSALGDLNEEILLGGDTYTWRDGKLNLLKCHAKWTKSADGGCLRIWRSHEKASFHEDRVVSGNTLTFTLYGENGTSWGRTFQRKN